ncbi:MAG: DNA repair protein RecO [Endomicrobia bacterium]|nr:DNA repair protein RecO [Endomicrobiia bacterium]MCL2798996.1 DNA repair protein RecO [Endomicrobiia bacterium]
MYYQIKGLVLNSNTYGETDKIAVIYSYEWGKIQAVVPSAKKINAKLASATEPLTESEFMVFQSHTSMRPKITGALIIKNNSALKTDFNKNLYALYAAEIADKFTPFNMENAEKYELISRVWELFADCKYPKRVLTAFTLRFLKLSGYSLSDYIKNNISAADKQIENAVVKLSRCSGSDADNLSDFDDNKTWNYVEGYLTNYIKRPSVSVFMRKVNL